jgi:hypothetical protein
MQESRACARLSGFSEFRLAEDMQLRRTIGSLAGG